MIKKQFMKKYLRKDLWNKLKISTRGTVIISWTLLIFTLAGELLGLGLKEYFVKAVFDFAIFVMSFSSLGLNCIEVYKKNKN